MDESSGSLAAPETQGQTPSSPGSAPPPTAPVDPYAPNWGADEWAEQAADVGMDPGTFKDLYPAARELIAQVAHGFRPLFEEEIAGRALGNDPAMVQAFGLFGQHRRQDQRDIDALRQDDARLAQQLGQPPSPPPRVAALTGEALQRQMAVIVDRYFPNSGPRRAMSHLQGDPHLMKGLTQLAQDASRRQQESQYYGQAVERRRAQLEAPETVKRLPSGQHASNDDLDASIDEARKALYEADKQGRRDEKARHLRTLERLYKSRYGGGDAA